MDLDSLLAPHRDAVERRLAELIALPARYAQHAPAAGAALLQSMSSHQLATGGKRLRGLLPAALVAAADGPMAAAVALGACVELMHNGTLVHDDIQDGDRLRRGQPTLWTQHGADQAINAGDALLMAPVAALLQDPDVPEDLRPALASLLAHALLETIRGQVADIALRDLAAPTLADLAAVHVAKTAPLFGACVVGAALLLRLPAAAIEAGYGLAADLGLAFQVRDDLLDVLGTKGRGAPGSDLREGKPTWPVLCAMQAGPATEAKALHELLAAAARGQAPDEVTVARWMAWVATHGGVAATEAELSLLLNRARETSSALLPPAAAQVMHALCDRLAQTDG